MLVPKKKRRSGATPRRQPSADQPALSSAEQAARREQQRAEWAAQKRAQERARRSSAPIVWSVVVIGSLLVVAVLGGIFLVGSGGSDEASPTPAATRDARLGAGDIAKTVSIDANDQGQNVNPTFSMPTIAGRVGEIIEIKVNNIGSVAHNLNFAGLDGEFGTRDDWTTTPQSIPAGVSGTVLVKFDKPGTYPFQCDFHPTAQQGNLILS